MTRRTPPFLPDGRPYKVSAVLFDFDGTLTQPGDLDFEAIRVAVDCPVGVGLLEYLDGVADANERRRKEAILEHAEIAAAGKGRLNQGALELVALLRRHRIPMAVITRNRLEAVERTMASLAGIERDDFPYVVTRDMGLGPKPRPDGVLHLLAEMGLEAAEVLLIGDHAYDIQAGRAAGTMTMFLRNHSDDQAGGDAPEEMGAVPADRQRVETSPESEAQRAAGADFIVRDLHEAARVIRYGLPLPLGKLPAELLEESIEGIEIADPAVLVSARLGEDAAAIDIRAEEVLVLASDPITLASDSPARYAVLANANDVATSGAVPRWMLTTLLFPPGTTASQVAALVRDIQESCRPWGISLCGGHTEITDAVSRPLISGTMAGTAPGGRVLDKRDMREGDRILLTKGVAVEGTGLIAREYGGRLAAGGMSAADIAEAAAFLDRMSILPEARLALESPGVTALHDVTEGGLATAVSELGAAGGRRLRLDLAAIPIYPQTRRICAIMGLDPLGLIGSGSLLITCSADQTDALVAAISRAGIEVAVIGEVGGEGRGVQAYYGTEPVEWPRFERDEVSRLSG